MEKYGVDNLTVLIASHGTNSRVPGLSHRTGLCALPPKRAVSGSCTPPRTVRARGGHGCPGVFVRVLNEPQATGTRPIPLATQHDPMLVRNLLYIGVTRGKQLVVLIGQPKAWALAVRNVRAMRRLTNLAARLRQ